MTAVEWLQDKWGNCKEWSWEEIKQWFEQAKQMEKQQIIDASERLKWVDYSLVQNGEQYYNENYGSGVLTEGSGAVGEKGGAVNKGSDDQVPDVRKMVKNNLLNECVYHNLCDRAMCPNKDVCINCQSTSSQTEISDEEIEKAALEYFADYKGGANQWEISAFIMGMKKYREQLKLK